VNNIGTFYVVSTPIGNLKDITIRAIECLKKVSLIAAEDTRRTQKLLSHLNIKCKIISCHEHNELKRFNEIYKVLKKGHSVALVSDAGNPGISDPGARLISKLREEDVEIIPIPGPSAVSCALSICGMPADSFYFVGFLPQKKKERQKILSEIKDIAALLVFFEAPHRIKKTLSDILKELGNRKIFFAREMTKRHETYILTTLEQLLDELPAEIRGEITFVVEGVSKQKPKETPKQCPKELEELIKLIMSNKKSRIKEVAEIISALLDINKSVIYNYCLQIQNALNGQVSK